MRGGKSGLHQGGALEILNPKQQTPNKYKIKKTKIQNRLKIGYLEIVVCLLFDDWFLVFPALRAGKW